jgi:thioredoxin 1
MSAKDSASEGKPLEISGDAAFDDAVLNSDLPVVVDFHAPWCGPCKAIDSSLKDLSREYKGQLVVAKVNVDDNARLAERYGIQSIPHLVYIHKGKILKRTRGGQPKAKLKSEFQTFLTDAAAEQ